MYSLGMGEKQELPQAFSEKKNNEVEDAAVGIYGRLQGELEVTGQDTHFEDLQKLVRKYGFDLSFEIFLADATHDAGWRISFTDLPREDGGKTMTSILNSPYESGEIDEERKRELAHYLVRTSLRTENAADSVQDSFLPYLFAKAQEIWYNLRHRKK